MQFSSGGALGALCAVLAFTAQARADQFIVTDVTYTHSKDTTSDSHYRVSPSAATPKDWSKPFDWTKGSVRVLLEVKTKPAGDTPTKFQICFEGNPTYSCTYQSDTYTKTGKYEWTTPFKNLWWDTSKPPMNWANGVTKVALILKDTNNGKPQGDPKYVPTDLHVEVAIVSEGATYQPPSAVPKDAGVADAGTPPKDAGSKEKDARVEEEPTDAGEVEEPQDSGVAVIDAATSRRDASTTPPKTDAGNKADDGETTDPATAGPTKSNDGCALGGPASQGWLALLALAFVRRRRAHPR